ncbi:hypothetical protein IC575_002812 [Cucumis melo]|uniref:Epidermal patterning factor-like protein n=1 Tax=Cucumis melo TaxID=3656 RepID=A0A1S3CDZ4_CUCME|nr:EPIDERMAL PATTERNING FACTOR-like protein 4 [Cucumis melo]
MKMALPISLSTSLKLALTLAAFFSFLPPTSVGLVLSRSGRSEGKADNDEMKFLEDQKMVIGSRPPGCQNKCMNCRPCMAAAVVPVHRMKGKAFQSFSSSREEEDSYYLLSWKCQCGNKIYQP